MQGKTDRQQPSAYGYRHAYPVAVQQEASIHVCFAPAARRNPDGTVSTRSLVSGVKCVRYGSTEDDQNQSGQGGSGEEEEGGTGSMG